jgi:hypothetical protein
MPQFVDYYNANKKQFKYTIKIAQNDLSADNASVLEQYLERYNLVEFRPFTKTPIQQNPIDFPNVRDSEVYITDIVVEYPITPNALHREVSSAMGINEQSIAIYSENDPRKQYEKEWLERVVGNKEYKENYKTRLGNTENWEEEPEYGQKYNENFLKSLKGTEDITDEVINDLSPSAKRDSASASVVEFDGEGTDAVLNDRWRNATDYSPRKSNTLMSTPVEEKTETASKK